MILGRFVKQPGETLDYPVSYDDWFVGRSDTPMSHAVTAETGITVVGSSRSGNVVTVTLSGGTHGSKYKITVQLSTTAGIVREADFIVAVKET